MQGESITCVNREEKSGSSPVDGKSIVEYVELWWTGVWKEIDFNKQRWISWEQCCGWETSASWGVVNLIHRVAGWINHLKRRKWRQYSGCSAWSAHVRTTYSSTDWRYNLLNRRKDDTATQNTIEARSITIIGTKGNARLSSYRCPCLSSSFF